MADHPLTLRTLKIAYPDLQDSIIDAVSGTQLSSLSLCDYPRFYIHRTSSIIHSRWSAPILSSSECLDILRRMYLPHLRRLELVYEVDDVYGSDEGLLQHVSTAFAGLSHLALHRYRRDRTQSVPYLHIAQLLTPAKSLRTIHLNLDLPENPGPYSEDSEARGRWLLVYKERGCEPAVLLQECTLLEHVALLGHGLIGSMWFEFYPPRFCRTERESFLASIKVNDPRNSPPPSPLFFSRGGPAGVYGQYDRRVTVHSVAA
ncbi:hypothetical protein C8Q80DRAFT_468037 [Daedaleopsis nitida]|nr:hypothetical protein C8Q80DRAFT_468037 [Daedaleopsis nitida]